MGVCTSNTKLTEPKKVPSQPTTKVSNPDAQSIILGSHQAVQIHDLKADTFVKIPSVSLGIVTYITYSYSTKSILVGDSKGNLSLVMKDDYSDPKQIALYPDHTNASIHSIGQIDSQKKAVVSANNQNSVKVVTYDSKEKFQVINEYSHEKSVFACIMSPCQTMMLQADDQCLYQIQVEKYLTTKKETVDQFFAQNSQVPFYH